MKLSADLRNIFLEIRVWFSQPFSESSLSPKVSQSYSLPLEPQAKGTRLRQRALLLESLSDRHFWTKDNLFIMLRPFHLFENLGETTVLTCEMPVSVCFSKMSLPVRGLKRETFFLNSDVKQPRWNWADTCLCVWRDSFALSMSRRRNILSTRLVVLILFYFYFRNFLNCDHFKMTYAFPKLRSKIVFSCRAYSRDL